MTAPSTLEEPCGVAALGGVMLAGERDTHHATPLAFDFVGRLLRAVVTLVAVLGALPAMAETVTVGSKNFAESRLLAEVFAQLIEAKTELTVERRLGLAGTELCFEALRTGAIDLYPEYTGTGLVTLLGEDPGGNRRDALVKVRREFLRRFDLVWLSPLGFENAYELAVPRRLAVEKSLLTISDLVPLAAELRGAFGYEFAERQDGLPGLEKYYGFELRNYQTMLQAPKYQAAGEGLVDVLDVYTTDGRLLVYDLQVLEDDRHFFPPYEAAALVRSSTLKVHPEIATALGLLAGAFDGDSMRQLNLRLQEDKEPAARVAKEALESLGLFEPQTEEQRDIESPEKDSFPAYLWQAKGQIGHWTLEHLALSALGLGLGVLLAVPLGLFLERQSTSLAETTIRLIGTFQTIPALALLGFLIPLFGVGVLPAILALWMYSLLPIVRNTYSGLRDADPEAVLAATSLGMTDRQVLFKIRLPLASPTIMAGIRTAGVITVGTATLAAFIGAGGLGEPILSGVQLVDSRRILAGAIPAALLALVVDFALGRLELALRPPGIDISRQI